MKSLNSGIVLLLALQSSAFSNDLWVIGQNSSGQLGDGLGAGRTVPFFLLPDVARVSAGGDFSLILKDDGTLWSTGSNFSGQLGDGGVLSRLSPVQIADDVAFPAAGYQSGCFVRNDGTLWAMGLNQFGQLGNGNGSNLHIPVQVATGVAQVAPGIYHTLIVKTDGTLWATGYNQFGQLGDGTNTTRYGFVQVASDVVEAAVGWEHSLLVKTDGTLWAMGSNYSGQHGTGGSTSSSPVLVTSGVARVAAGESHSLFVKQDGTLWAMGSNSDGELGNGGYYAEPLPVQVATDVVAIAAGTAHSLYQTADGKLWGMGNNASGQLGVGTMEDHRLPVVIAEKVAQFSAGNEHTMFVQLPRPPMITTQSTTLVVGINQPAMLEITTFSTLPVSYQWYAGTSGDTVQPVTGATGSTLITPALAIGSTFWVRASNDAGSIDSDSIIVQVTAPPEIALQPRGAIIATGEGPVLFVAATGAGLTYQWFRGESGDISAPVAGATGPTLVAPALAADTLFWARVSNPAGSANSMAAPVTIVSRVATDLWALGRNFDQELGTGTAGPARVPVRIATEVAQVAMGRSHNLFVRTDGSLWGMGSNNNGELGLGSVGSTELVPVHAGNGVVTAAAGTSFSLFVKSDASMWAVGYNTHGQLGDGIMSEFRTSPVEVARDVAEVFAGAEHSLFIKTDGSLWGMGDNNRGQLGIGDDGGSRIPIKITDGVVRVATSRPPQYGAHTLFVTADGTLWAMGANSEGQLGDGTTTDRRTPVAIASEVVEVAVGDFFSLFLKADGTAWGMGSNPAGQLGIGTTTDTNSPVQVGSGIVHLGAGAFHSLLTRVGGTIEVAGANYNLQVGDAFENFSATRVPIANAGGVTNGTADGTMFLRMPTPSAPTGASFEHLIAVGQSTSVHMAADSAMPFSYQWYLGPEGDDTNPVAGATNATFTTPVLNSTTEYWVRIGNITNETEDVPVTVLVTPPPALPVPVSGVTALPGRTPSLSVAASGLGLTYQWYRGAAGDTADPVDGAVSDRIMLPPLHASGSYWVRVTNVAGSIDSGTVPVTVPPTIATDLMAAGDNHFGQLGDGTTMARSGPVKVAEDVVWMSATRNEFQSVSSFFLKSDGGLWATGDNFFGTFGDGTTTSTATPVLVAADVAQVAAGGSHTHFLYEDGTLWAVGQNQFGQLGDGSTEGRTTLVPIASGVASVAAGRSHTMFLGMDGTLWTTGSNDSGQIGDGGSFGSSFTYRIEPVAVATEVVQVAAGSEHSLFLKDDGTLWAMGRNSEGQLGDGTMDNRNTPVQVAASVAQVAAGSNHSVFLKTDGTVWATGQNFYGALGDGTTTSRSAPVMITTGVTNVSAGSAHSMFLKEDGTLWTTGQNGNGELADGTTTNRSSLVQVATRVSMPVAGQGYSFFLQAPEGSVAAFTLIASGDQSAPVGGHAAFNVVAGGTPVPSYYQWQRREAGATEWRDLTESVAFAGTRTPALDVHPSATTQNGDEFRCVVGNGVPPLARSVPAILTVTKGNAVVTLGGLNQIYDGTPRTVTFDTNPAGLSVVVSYAGSISPPTNAGTYPVIATIDDVNYTGTGEGVLAIAPLVELSQTGTIAGTTAGTLALEVGFEGSLEASFQWQYRASSAAGPQVVGTANAIDGWGDIPGARGPTLFLPSVQRFHVGEYRVVVTANGVSQASAPVTVEVLEVPSSNARLTNLSTRALALTGDKVLIPGFVIEGPGNKQLLIRAVGPTLATAPFNLAGTLPNPRIALKRFNGSGYDDVTANDDWGTNTNVAELFTRSGELGAFPLVDASADAALLVDLAPGQYSVVTDDPAAPTGIAIVELYDADEPGSTSRLINISNRGYVGAGDNIMIPGFVVSDEGPKTLLIRVVGPTLGTFGVPDVLTDPTLSIFRHDFVTNTDDLILTNDDWSTGPGAERTRDVAAQVFAFPLPEGSKDAAFVVTLNPGVYTVHARGANNTDGVALVEVYAVP